MTQTAWPKAVTKTVADEVLHYRKMRGMSTEQLSDRTDECGHRIHRSVLANLESGRRANITVPDLVVLGRALGVPPLVLLYPVGRAGACEVMPGKYMDPWDAAKMFTGELADDDGIAAAEDLGLFREHDRLVRAWERARRQAEDDPGSELSAASLVEGALVRVRAMIRSHGLMPPEVPPSLAAALPEAA